MKRIICLAVALVFALTVPFTASAATRDEVLAQVKKDMPESYHDLYMESIKNIFAQIETTDEQCDKLIEIMDRFSSTLDLTKGYSIHNYTSDEVDYIYSIVDEICDLLGLSYKIVPKTSGELHAGDIKAMIYGPGGELIGELDGDIVKRTDAPDKSVDMGGLYTTGALLVAAMGAFMLRKKVIAVI